MKYSSKHENTCFCHNVSKMAHYNTKKERGQGVCEKKAASFLSDRHLLG